MPYDSNGNATIDRNRAVTGQTVQAAQVNVPFDDVQSMLSQVLLRSGVAPMTGALNMNGFKIQNSPEGSAPSDLVTVSQLDDPWRFQPIGVPFPCFGPPPPKSSSFYRYILLSAGFSGVGQYNNGVFSSETSVGVAPTISAAAIISLSGSPFDGVTVRLINTERRFIRPRETFGDLEESANLAHFHSGTTDGGGTHNHGVDGVFQGTGGAGATSGVSGLGGFTGLSGFHNHTFVTSATGGPESRPRSVGAPYYMRIK